VDAVDIFGPVIVVHRYRQRVDAGRVRV